ncbi:hypothetical protein FRB97_002232, partial [Tulasnella sp. 331]
MVKSCHALAVSDVPLKILEKHSSKYVFNMARACKDALKPKWRTVLIKLSWLLSTLTPPVDTMG